MTELAIGTISASERTMLLHVIIYWLERSYIMLCNLEFQYALDIWNSILDDTM